MIQELRNLREIAELLSNYVADNIKLTADEWKYVGINLEIMKMRVNDLINELTDLAMTIDKAKSFIERGNYNDARMSLIAIADSLSTHKCPGDLSG